MELSQANIIVDHIDMLLRTRRKEFLCFHCWSGNTWVIALNRCQKKCRIMNTLKLLGENNWMANIPTLKILFRYQIEMISTSSPLGTTLIFGLACLTNSPVLCHSARRMPGSTSDYEKSRPKRNEKEKWQVWVCTFHGTQGSEVRPWWRQHCGQWVWHMREVVWNHMERLLGAQV